MNKSHMRQFQRTFLLRLIDEAFNKSTWHGTNLRGSIRRVSAAQAVWRPGRGRRNIAAVVVHCAYWKYAVRRRLTGEKRGSFPLKGSNWFAIPAKLADEKWRDYVKLLDATHQALHETIASVAWSRLTAGPGGRQDVPASHIHGVAMHDVYHAGQIQTLKALYKQATGR